MNRDEFEAKYAQKYMGLSFVHNPTEAIESVKELRDGEGYTDHHIDLCWKVQKAIDTANKSFFFNENARIRIRQMLEW